LTCILARKIIWKTPATTLTNTLKRGGWCGSRSGILGISSCSFTIRWERPFQSMICPLRSCLPLYFFSYLFINRWTWGPWSSDIKSGSVWRVDLKPGWSGDWTGSGLSKNQSNPVDPAGQPVTRLRPGQDPVFLFFKCEIWNLLVYIHYVPKKKIMFFQCGIKNFLI